MAGTRACDSAAWAPRTPSAIAAVAPVYGDMTRATRLCGAALVLTLDPALEYAESPRQGGHLLCCSVRVSIIDRTRLSGS